MPDSKAAAPELPSEDPSESQPTDLVVAEAPCKDSSLDLAIGLSVAELPIDEMDARLLGLSASLAMRPSTAAEQRARELGIAARNAGCLPDASPYEACSQLDLVWLDGFRSAS